MVELISTLPPMAYHQNTGDSGSREVDLYPTLAAMLKEYLDKHQGMLKSNLLFQSKSGKALHQSKSLFFGAHCVPSSHPGKPQ
ncbi:MAG TPA: hypothetical protein VGX94_03740 [Terriglobia bacterium]|nr:hypothetical protein [Terriglobia bacterium]